MDLPLLNTMTRDLTAFKDFSEMCDEAQSTGYSPTLRGWDKHSNAKYDHLAAAFDVEMERRGATSRAWPKR